MNNLVSRKYDLDQYKYIENSSSLFRLFHRQVQFVLHNARLRLTKQNEQDHWDKFPVKQSREFFSLFFCPFSLFIFDRWTTKKKVIVGIIVAAIVLALIGAGVFLAVWFTRDTSTRTYQDILDHIRHSLFALFSCNCVYYIDCSDHRLLDIRCSDQWLFWCLQWNVNQWCFVFFDIDYQSIRGLWPWSFLDCNIESIFYCSYAIFGSLLQGFYYRSSNSSDH